MSEPHLETTDRYMLKFPRSDSQMYKPANIIHRSDHIQGASKHEML